jgi:hypothetical protein
MYTTPPKENNYSRPRTNLGVRNSGSDWRARSVSPSNGAEHNALKKRSVSPIPDSLSSASDAGSTRQAGKYARRPLPTTAASGSGAGQSVAALQQHHQWLMQQQEGVASRNTAGSNYRSVSPIPNKSSSNNMKPFKPQQHQFNTAIINNNDDEDVVYDNTDGEDEGEDVEEERMVVIQDVRARSPSINRGKLCFQIINHYFSISLGIIYRRRGIHHVCSTST